MKAVLIEKYGLPEKVLVIDEVAMPRPKDNEVLVKIYATTINDYDWSIVSGKPYLYRLLFGLFKPRHQIAGMELSGIVESIGSNVSGFKVGDAVFGDTSGFGFGTFAEYICINEKALIHKPVDLSHEEATSIPHAFALASQALRDIGDIKHGMKILINGGGGGVGTFGLQLAKTYECEVTGVDSSDKLEMMKSLGFDHVIDYKKTNFTKNGEKFDLILDCKTNKSAFAYLRALKTEGRYVTIGGDLGKVLSVVFIGLLVSVFSSKKLKLVGLQTNKGLDYFVELFNQNKIKTTIDGPYKFEDIPRLIQYFGDGKHKGKIVVSIHDQGE